jgi:hypothetical protein
MEPVLVALAVGLMVGWGVLWWLLRQHTSRTAQLEEQVNEMSRKVESHESQ